MSCESLDDQTSLPSAVETYFFYLGFNLLTALQFVGVKIVIFTVKDDAYLELKYWEG